MSFGTDPLNNAFGHCYVYDHEIIDTIRNSTPEARYKIVELARKAKFGSKSEDYNAFQTAIQNPAAADLKQIGYLGKMGRAAKYISYYGLTEKKALEEIRNIASTPILFAQYNLESDYWKR